MADDAGMLICNSVGHDSGLHKVVNRAVQQPVQEVTSVMSDLVDSLSQAEVGKKIHHSGCGWFRGWGVGGS